MALLLPPPSTLPSSCQVLRTCPPFPSGGHHPLTLPRCPHACVWQAVDRAGCKPIDLAMKHPKIVKMLVEHKDIGPPLSLEEVRANSVGASTEYHDPCGWSELQQSQGLLQ